jgi:hypothetical protein
MHQVIFGSALTGILFTEIHGSCRTASFVAMAIEATGSSRGWRDIDFIGTTWANATIGRCRQG